MDPATRARSFALRYADRFIPESIRRDGHDAIRRARMLVWFPYPIVLTAIPASVELAARGAYSIIALIATTSVLTLLSPLLLRRTGSVIVVGNLLLATLMTVVVALCWVAGGLGAPALYMVVLAPLLGTLVAGVRFGVMWAVIALLVVGCFVAFYALDIGPVSAVDPAALIRGHAIIATLLVVVTISGTILYERLRQRALDEIAALHHRAEAANRAKDEFLANISHELRTPMTGVITASSMLAGEPLGQRLGSLAHIIHSSASSLLVVIDDILDFARIETGRLRLVEAPFDIAAVLRAVVGLMAPDASAKGVALTHRVAGGPSISVMGDEARVRQILLNLVGNAVKFTDEGAIEVALTSEARGDAVRIRIEVADTGIGMSAEQLTRVFERFEQVDRSSSNRRGGLGLGLAISRQLVDLMHGTLTAESTPGQGSRFRFEVEFAAAPEIPSQRALSPQAVNLDARILLAEDDRINQTVCSVMLARLGCEVDVASSGAAAVEMIQQQPYDLVLMDCFMPEVDGFSATRQIRQLGGQFARTPIIAFTASGTENDRSSCLDAGMNDILIKPPRHDNLVAMLSKWLDQSRR